MQNVSNQDGLFGLFEETEGGCDLIHDDIAQDVIGHDLAFALDALKILFFLVCSVKTISRAVRKERSRDAHAYIQ